MLRKQLILHVCPHPHPLGGIWTYIRHIMESPLAEIYEFNHCFYTGRSGGVSWRDIRDLAQEVRTRSPDLVHLHGLQTEGFNCLLASRLGCRAPRLLTVHGFIEDSKFRTPWRRALIARVLEPATVRMASAAYTVSRYGAKKPVLRRWARRHLGCIDNALPVACLPPGDDARTVRQRLGWSQEHVVAVCVARLSREKGLLDLAEAFALVSERLPMLRLLLVGDGPDADHVRARLAGSEAGERAVLHPATPEVMPLLCASDLFVLPSLHENQSFAILEAMAAGLPVLSTEVGGTPELVRHGETGWLVPPSQPKALAEGLERLVKDAVLRHRLGQAGQQAASRDHSFPVFLDRIAKVYDSLLASRR